MGLDHLYEYEIDESFEKAYPWDPPLPKGWQYREGINRNGKPYRGYFPSPFDDAEPFWLEATPPYGDPEVKAREAVRRARLEERDSRRRSYGSGDPSSSDLYAAMYFDIPNVF